MAVMYIREYSNQNNEGRGYLLNVGLEPARASQNVTFSTTTASAAFGADTHYIRLSSDTACHFDFGSSPTATTNDTRMAADSPEYFAVRPGQKVAMVTA